MPSESHSDMRRPLAWRNKAVRKVHYVQGASAVPFAVQDFQDLLRLLDEHPEWQAELRRRLLTEELIELPALVRSLAEGQAVTNSQLASLTQQVDALAEQMDALTIQVATLASTQDAIVYRLQVQTQRLDSALGDFLENRYERHAGAYFSPLARKIMVVDSSVLADLLDDAVADGRIAEGDRNDALHADLVLTGQRRGDRVAVYLVAEVSIGIGVDDVRRAADRASVMARLGRPAMAVVAGERIDPEPAELALARGVWQILDGHSIKPGSDAE
jgi:DNA-binding transcriptional MerR regulator